MKKEQSAKQVVIHKILNCQHHNHNANYHQAFNALNQLTLQDLETIYLVTWGKQTDYTTSKYTYINGSIQISGNTKSAKVHSIIQTRQV